VTSGIYDLILAYLQVKILTRQYGVLISVVKTHLERLKYGPKLCVLQSAPYPESALSCLNLLNDVITANQ